MREGNIESDREGGTEMEGGIWRERPELDKMFETVDQQTIM